MAYLMYWAHSEKSTLGTFSGASNSSEKVSLYSGVLRAFLQCNCGRKNECHFLRLSKKNLNDMKNQTEKIRYSHWSPAAGESAVEVGPIVEGFEEELQYQLSYKIIIRTSEINTRYWKNTL